jgi:hypothetical protein
MRDLKVKIENRFEDYKGIGHLVYVLITKIIEEEDISYYEYFLVGDYYDGNTMDTHLEFIKSLKFIREILNNKKYDFLFNNEIYENYMKKKK